MNKISETTEGRREMHDGRRRPLIVMSAFPAAGHLEGLLQIAAHLTSRGFQVFFLCGDAFEQRARDAGAEPWGNALPLTPEIMKGQYDFPPGPLRWNYQQKHIFIDGTAPRHEILTKCLESVRERFPDREVIIFNEALFLGVLPYLLGAPPPRGYERFPKIIHFNSTINLVESKDVAPYGSLLPPAENDADRIKFRGLYDEQRPVARDTMAYANRIFRSLGATRDLAGDFITSEMLCLPEAMLMACSPSLEYPRSDLPPTIKYIGGMPLKKCSAKLVFPDWWDTFQVNSTLPRGHPERKKVILLTQGTANNDDYGELVIPTVRALASRKDLTVIALLGKRGAKLLDIVSTSENTKVLDYFPYDVILRLTDVFVLNGGYGGFMHGVMNGVPMVLAGMAADKGEVAARAEWAGIGVNLRTSTPTEAAISDAVDRILSDEEFKGKAMEIKAENDALDALGAIEKQIWELTDL